MKYEWILAINNLEKVYSKLTINDQQCQFFLDYEK